MLQNSFFLFKVTSEQNVFTVEESIYDLNSSVKSFGFWCSLRDKSFDGRDPLRTKSFVSGVHCEVVPVLVVVSYDVSTVDRVGRRRLRQVARACTDHGERVQNSVFQCLVDPDQWVRLRARLLDIVDPETDSIRFFFLGRNWKARVEHHGVRKELGVDELLIV